ncbi:MAG: T9SS type A sorting domain-containing protein [Paludibacteraceae bacterium]
MFGTHNVKIDISNLQSGVYYYTLSVDDKKMTKSMILAK